VVPIITASTGPLRSRPGQQLAQGGGDAARHVGRGRRLDGVDDVGAVEEHGFGVRPADIDADAPHANTEVNSRS
jgi:hypothetical protein